MTITNIVRAKDFSQVAEVKSDDKRRVMLKRVKKSSAMYRIYENSLGQVFLDPIVTIPASEAWLFEDKALLATVQKGIRESIKGVVVKKARKARVA